MHLSTIVGLSAFALAPAVLATTIHVEMWDSISTTPANPPIITRSAGVKGWREQKDGTYKQCEGQDDDCDVSIQGPGFEGNFCDTDKNEFTVCGIRFSIRKKKNGTGKDCGTFPRLPGEGGPAEGSSYGWLIATGGRKGGCSVIKDDSCEGGDGFTSVGNNKLLQCEFVE